MKREAEEQKLAHTLGVSPARLAMVGALPAEELRTLRRQAGSALFEADRLAFSRVAALSKVVPAAVSAKLSQTVLPPLLAARVSELLEPARAVDLVNRLSESYLADVSAAMDPLRCPELIAAIPPDRVAVVGRELARREDWIVIGGFVSAVSSEALARSIAVFDGGQLLRIGFVLEDLARLDEITGLVSDDQLDGMLTAAASDGLWAELSTLLEQLSPPRAVRIAARLAAAPPSVRDAVLAGPLSADAAAKLAASS